jgi:predicted DNA-binding protein
MMRGRYLRMEDQMWEAMDALAERSGRTTSEEFRVAVETWLRTAGNTPLAPSTRRVTVRHERKGKV